MGESQDDSPSTSPAPSRSISMDAVKDAWNGTLHSSGSGAAGASVFDERWERSAENMAIMLTAGLFTGGVLSTLLFRGPRLRMFGTGFGAGCGVGSSWTTIRYKIYGENVLSFPGTKKE